MSSLREIWSVASSFFSTIWQTVWWARGVVLAFFIVNLVTSQLSLLQRDEFLRLTHAIMVVWAEVANELGQWIGKTPWLPILDEAQVNALIICSAIMLPPAVQIFTRHQSLSFYLRWTAYIFAFIPLLFFWFSYLFRTNDPLIAVLLIAVGVSSSFREMLLIYPGFAKGIFTGFTLFLTLEALYFFQLPIFAEKANAFTCRVLESPEYQCEAND